MQTENNDLGPSRPHDIVPLEQAAIRLNVADDVAIAKADLMPGTTLELKTHGCDLSFIEVKAFVPSGHKVALRRIAAGGPVRRYGRVIGFASRDIQAGEHVHTHNLGVKEFAREYAFGADVQPVDLVPLPQRRTFAGYRRHDGRVGTRNYVAVIPTVTCSAHVTRQIAHHFSAERLAAYPNVDGVIAFVHHAGCSVKLGGEDYVLLQRSLAGMARHPNVGAYLLVGLGCEANQIGDLVGNYALGNATKPPPSLMIQELGGVRKTIQAGVEAVSELLAVANAVRRTPQPVSELTLALHCGGSDGWSGVTANPLVGQVADRIVYQGGTVVLGETPEIYGAEQLLTRRAISQSVGQKLVDLVRWWEGHTQRLGIEIDNNPSPGNKAGGLTTIYEKSLGAVVKGGSTPLTGVYKYAEPVTAKGFTFMDTPGNDWTGLTGQVAGGSNVVLFTTGRGSVLGFRPAPVIKICTNSKTFKHMAEDMDFDAGRLLEGATMDALAAELYELTIAVASGQASKSEAQGMGELEFCPWSLGGML